MADLLRYGQIVRPSDQTTLVLGSISDNASSYTKEAIKIKDKMIQAELNPNERKKIVSKNGAWICEADGNNILYMVLIAQDYPERLGYQLINEFKRGLSDVPNYYNASAAEITRSYEGKFMELSKKYNNPASFDSMTSVTGKVDVATKKMEDNIKKALENQQDLNNVNAKTENLKNLAEEFNENADELRKIMYWRNMKLKMIMGMMGGAATFSVVMPIFQKFVG
jgi:Synaptobrevin